MNLLTNSLHYIGKNYQNLKAVQIGAMDGINFDDTRGFFDMYKWDTILVEPIPELFEELKYNLRDRTNLKYENVAISSKEGTLKMLTIPSEAIKEHNLHPGYKGMSAVYPLKNGFGTDYDRDIEVKTKHGVDIEVPCITLDQLLERNNFSDLNILVCDAEGYDWEIFKKIDLKKFNLMFIRLEYINLSDKEKQDLQDKLEAEGYVVEISHDIDAVKKEIYNKIYTPQTPETKPNTTLVTGLWNIGREERSFEEIYIPRFKALLNTDVPMILFLPQELHDIVWEIRKPFNTQIKTVELEDIKSGYFQPHWNNYIRVRNKQEWQNITGESGWLKNSPQLKYEMYNPVVMSKMFMLHDASIYNTFNTDYFYWIDAGLNITVHGGLLNNKEFYQKVIDVTDPFLFISFPYIPAGEIHGFNQKAAEKLTNTKIEYVCRGGFFGGHKEQISHANSMYYGLVESTLRDGYMGTEESIFTLMSYLDPVNYRRCEIHSNGLLYTFFEDVISSKAKLVDIPKSKVVTKKEVFNLSKYKTNLYILTFNFPDQVLHTIESMKKVPEWLEKPHLVLLDNSTNEKARSKNREIAREYNFEYISLEGNTGICGGRQFAAEHFHQSDADFYFFFEDDMTSNPPEFDGQFCRNGLRKFIPNIYEILHKIILKEDFDFLKMSFTEVYWDNNIQTSWYNVPQQIRTQFWPNYDKLPTTGRDPNAPRTQFGNIDNVDGVAYIDGDITYTNWPMIMSKKGNQKVFIDTKWAHPYEQTWMSYVFQEQKKGNIRAGVLLASPIWHERIKHYKPEERREN